MQKEVSMGDLMNAIKTLENQIQCLDTKFTLRFDQTDSRFSMIDSRFDQTDSRFSMIDSRFDRIDSDIAEIHEAIQILSTDTDEHFNSITEQFNKRFVKIESQMVTKDYLDEKMGALRGDMIQRIRTGFPKLAV